MSDQVTGLVHFGAREYDPEVGRWVERDPIGFAGGTTGLYEYAGALPIDHADPTGRSAASVAAWVAGGVAVVGVIVLAYVNYDVSYGADQAALATKLPGRENGPQDAVRHCIATCIGYANYGETAESLMEWAHPEDASTPAGHMDAMNNGEGVVCGGSLPPGDTTRECTKACVSAYHAGRLEVMPRSAWRH